MLTLGQCLGFLVLVQPSKVLAYLAEVINKCFLSLLLKVLSIARNHC